MRKLEDIRDYREDLRNQINSEPTELKKEILREQIFTLDKVAGLFNKGVPLTQLEVFELLQIEQRKTVSSMENPITHDEVKTVGAIKAYQWVMG